MKTSLSLLSLFLFFAALSFSACAERRETVSHPLVQTNTQTVNTPLQPAPKPVSQKSNTAIVISPHANLRQSDSASAAVLRVVPQDAAVEVIKQQGGWFLVKTETEQGWMHGNTLKLQSFDINPTSQAVKQQTPSLPKIRQTPEPDIDNSGATAKCRDGSLSYSAHRRGTCSHHGGVAQWY